MRRKTNDVYHYMDLKDSFNHFDTDRDGVLSAKEVHAAVESVLHKEPHEPIVFEY
jgi:Ca2+-binding EF-hand superfamily protein